MQYALLIYESPEAFENRGDDGQTSYVAAWRSYYASLYDEEGIRRVSAAVGRLATYCRDNRIQCMVANYPELRDPKNYAFTEVEEAVRRIAAGHQLRFVELRPAVRDLPPETLWVTPPDPHPSTVAHEAFAKALAPVFEAQLKR